MHTQNSTAFAATELGQAIERGELPEPFFISGDAAFCLGPSMITPSYFALRNRRQVRRIRVESGPRRQLGVQQVRCQQDPIAFVGCGHLS